MFSSLHLSDMWEVSASLENNWAGIRFTVIAAVERTHARERGKRRLHTFWEIKLRLHWYVQAVHWNSLIQGGWRRDGGRDGGQEQARIKKWRVRKPISVRLWNSFARMEKYETWSCSALVNLWLRRAWWRMECFAVPAQSWINFSTWTFMSRYVKLKYYFFQISVFWLLLSGLFRKKTAPPPPPLASPTIRWIWLCSNSQEANLPSQACWLALGFFSACCCLLVDPCRGTEHN